MTGPPERAGPLPVQHLARRGAGCWSALDTGARMEATEEVTHVAMTIDGDHHDRRIEAILTDPKGYFDRARRRAEAKVRREMEQERSKPDTRTA